MKRLRVNMKCFPTILCRSAGALRRTGAEAAWRRITGKCRVAQPSAWRLCILAIRRHIIEKLGNILGVLSLAFGVVLFLLSLMYLFVRVVAFILHFIHSIAGIILILFCIRVLSSTLFGTRQFALRWKWYSDG